jgi:transcription elongation factor GreA
VRLDASASPFHPLPFMAILSYNLLLKVRPGFIPLWGVWGIHIMTDAAAKIRSKLEEEIKTIEFELNTELPKELMKARAHGDLSENAEYKYAKERQGFLSARLGQLKKRLGDISMLKLDNLPRDRAAYGSRVKLVDLKSQVEIEYTLVTAEESDVSKGMISTSSPIGKALLGRQAGDEVKVQTPAGIKEFEIVKLLTIHEIG